MPSIEYVPLASEALRRGEALAAAGRLDAATALLDYARRLLPDDPATTLAAASVRLRANDPEAAPLLRAVLQRHDLREAWLGLAASLRRAGDRAGAASALAAVLSRHVLPADAGLPELFDAVARDAGAPGWCGLDRDGWLRVTAEAPVAVLLDGTRLPARRAGRIKLPLGWRQAGRLEVLAGSRPLVGSSIDLGRLTRAEGFVEARAGGLAGWAWVPHDPDRDPEIEVSAAGDGFTLRATEPAPEVAADGLPPLARPRRFAVPVARLAGLDGPVRVLGPDGRELYGSPVDPQAELASARAGALQVRALFPAGPVAAPPPVPLAAIPADLVVPAVSATPRDRAIDVVVPVYRGRAETLACLESVFATVGGTTRVVVVEDASPEPELVAALIALAEAGRITLLRQPRNRGFPAAANAGLRHGPDRDAVLLNSDTIVPPGWLDRLRDAARSAPDIGTVTPLSGEATILSYPDPAGGNPAPDAAETRRLDGLAWAANGAALVDVPTAIGFCMYIRRDCLDAVGLLREDVFAQGYAEENDFCLRARVLGWRHVGHTGLYVAHLGGTSFGGARAHLIARNMRVLNRLHPGYAALIDRFQAVDPVAPARRRIDRLRWRERLGARESVVLVTHARGGGVARHLRERCAALREAGLHPVVLVPTPEGCRIEAGDGSEAAMPNLVFALPAESAALLALLREARPRLVELHHMLGHHPMVAQLHAELGVPQDIVVHDYAHFCARIALVTGARRYCGEPDLAGCEACVADHGSELEEEIAPTMLVRRSAAWLAAARRVVAPSGDAARRLARHFPHVRAVVEPWEEAPPIRRPDPPAGDEARICIPGAIGVEKGYDLILACARDAARRDLPMRFVLVGHSIDDARLLDTGRVRITGPYREGEAERLIRAQSAHLGWLTSLWPETWSYTLTELWRAGLDVAVFDLGAPAERIAARGRGWLMPLGLPPEAVNDALLRWCRGLGPVAPAGPGQRPGSA